jgi:hypothetical protein
VALDGAQRSGFLTQRAFLASHTPSAGVSPVGLGTTAHKRLLCQRLPDPAADVPQPSNAAHLSIRECFDKHAPDAAFSG